MNINSLFKKNFKNSYGFDKFSQYLLIVGLLFLLSKSSASVVLGLAIIGYALFRALSKNRYKRQQELDSFTSLLYTINIQFRKIKNRIEESLKFKVLSCPKCSQKLRVPRRKGKIVIKCKKCHNEFKAKS